MGGIEHSVAISTSMSEVLPEPGRIAFVRQRRYLVEGVMAPPAAGEASLVNLSCLDDDAQGEPLTVLWEHELDARMLTDDRVVISWQEGIRRSSAVRRLPCVLFHGTV